MTDAAGTVKRQWQSWHNLVTGTERREIEYFGRVVISQIAWIVSAIVLVENARRDDNPSAMEIAKRWITMKSNAHQNKSWEEAAILDREIVFPELYSPTAAPKL